METLDNVGIKLCVLGCNERRLVLSFVFLFFFSFALCSASVNALHIVFSNSLYESTANSETYQNFKEDRLWVHV